MRNVPWAVLLAAVALAIAIAVQIGLTLAYRNASGEAGWAQFAFAGAIAVLLLAGILRGNRLAWLWGRYLGLLLGVLVTVTTVLLVVRTGAAALPAAAILLPGLALPLFVTWFALGRRSALAHFELVCPVCHTPARRGNDFLFQKARCLNCQNVW